MKINHVLVFLVCLTCLMGCGTEKGVSLGSAPLPEGGLSPDDQRSTSGVFQDQILGVDEQVFLLGSDFFSSSQLYTASSKQSEKGPLYNTGVTDLGTEAVVRFFDGKIYIVHRGGQFNSISLDNIQILDFRNNFKTINQWSTGNGTNPSDIVVVGNKGYITLYDPEQDPSNVDEKGHPGDLIVMNLENGAIEKRISFFDFLFDDDYKRARAAQMLYVAPRLYVCLQDLGTGAGFPGFVEQNAQGLLAVINTDSNTVEDIITLQGRNPFDIAYSSREDKIFIAHLAPFGIFPQRDLATKFGGVEVLSRSDLEHSVFILDEDLGGYVENLAIKGDELYTVASNLDPVTLKFSSQILKAPVNGETPDDFSSFVTSEADARDLLIDAYQRVWVSQRLQKFQENIDNFWVEVFDSETGESLAVFDNIDVPIASMAVGSL